MSMTIPETRERLAAVREAIQGNQRRRYVVSTARAELPGDDVFSVERRGDLLLGALATGDDAPVKAFDAERAAVMQRRVDLAQTDAALFRERRRLEEEGGSLKRVLDGVASEVQSLALRIADGHKLRERFGPDWREEIKRRRSYGEHTDPRDIFLLENLPELEERYVALAADLGAS